MPLTAKEAICKKAALRLFYGQAYRRFAAVLARSPREGLAVELGAGSGLSKQFMPELLATDIAPQPGLDLAVDAHSLPFPDNSLRAVFMLNALHHMPDPELVLAEIARCLMPGGRALITDQYPGFPGSLVFRLLHDEPYDPRAASWKSAAANCMSGANGAIAHIIFERDKEIFRSRFPNLELAAATPHTPLLYWMSGGLKDWKLIPDPLAEAAARTDGMLNRLCPLLSSFADFELLKK